MKKYFPILLFCVVAFLFSCSTKKNTVVSRAYHNLTAHYNGYFNARERVKEGSKTLADAHEDHYDRLLSVFKYGDETKAKTVFPDMDAAIKKTSIVIQRHSMNIEGKERCKWIPYNYLVLGKAQFFKHDYWTAIETFQYIASSYRDKNQKYPRYEAMIYLIQSYMQLGKMADAEYLIDFIKNEKEFSKKLKPLFNATVADFYIQKKEYKQASTWLQQAAKLTKVRADRIRYTYILGQLYQKTDSTDKAFAMYQKVIKMNPDYEMAFNAKINRARSFDVNSPEAAKVKQELIKMLKDEKNADYLDQIYFALAGISLKENDTPQAIRYLEQSVAKSTTNVNQKGLSYLEMGEIYFKQPEYRSAQKYYDSAATFISPDYPDYALIQNKKNNLGRLIKNLNIIAEEDSMLSIANLSQAEREAKIDNIIKAEEEIAQKKKEEEATEKEKEEQDKILRSQQQGQLSQVPTSKDGSPTTSVGGQWYFYNQSTLSFGFTEFIKKWGNRKLEDNWRRTSKQSELVVNPENENQNSTEASDSAEAVLAARNDSIQKLDAEKRKKAYLEKLPVAAQQKDESNNRILEAYYNAGVIYKEQLSDPKAASGSFETMDTRYPNNKYLLASYYNLYRCYLSMEDSAKATYYKNLILDKYPDSEYARIITNPNYFKDAIRRTAIAQVFYENTYRAYVNRQYNDVIQRKAEADSMFAPSNLSPKFSFLKSMAVGKTQPLPTFVASLNQFILDYPKDSLNALAKDILDKINHRSAPAPNDSLSSPKQKPEELFYKFNADTAHSVLILFDSKKVDINQLKNNISDYNTLYYSTANLKITNSLIDSKTGYVQVKSFGDATKASQYVKNLSQDPDAFKNIDEASINVFAITQENYIRFLGDKDINKYLAFYRKNYE